MSVTPTGVWGTCRRERGVARFWGGWSGLAEPSRIRVGRTRRIGGNRPAERARPTYRVGRRGEGAHRDVAGPTLRAALSERGDSNDRRSRVGYRGVRASYDGGWICGGECRLEQLRERGVVGNVFDSAAHSHVPLSAKRRADHQTSVRRSLGVAAPLGSHDAPGVGDGLVLGRVQWWELEPSPART